MRVVVEGVDEAIQNLRRIDQDLSNMREPMQRATLLVSGSARKNAPVDRGLTRASITPSVSSSGNETTGIVGSNLKSALFMELGTRPHWPPLAALETWARRHGTTAYLVARAIARRGLKARRFLQKALDSNTGKIVRIFNDYVNKVTR